MRRQTLTNKKGKTGETHISNRNAMRRDNDGSRNICIHNPGQHFSLANGNLETGRRSLAIRQQWPSQLEMDGSTSFRSSSQKGNHCTVIESKGAYKTGIVYSPLMEWPSLISDKPRRCRS